MQFVLFLVIDLNILAVLGYFWRVWQKASKNNTMYGIIDIEVDANNQKAKKRKRKWLNMM
jgi:hypothetical protein